MNIKEFAALKPGDRITNPMSASRGVVVGVDDKGVSIHWGGDVGRRTQEGATGTIRHYSVASTIWMHWSVEELPECGTQLSSPA